MEITIHLQDADVMCNAFIFRYSFAIFLSIQIIAYTPNSVELLNFLYYLIDFFSPNSCRFVPMHACSYIVAMV